MIENDAFWVAPGAAAIERAAREQDVTPQAAAGEMLARRAAMMELAKGDPFRFGYEPDVWLVCRAMLGLDRIPDVRREMLARRTGKDEARVWPWWRDALCERLGLRRYVSELFIPGANRASKTDLAAKVCHEVGMETNRKIWIGSQQWAMSIETQQARVYRYLPQEWRKDVRSAGEYIRFTEKNGFTGNGFVNRMGSRFKFMFYTQKRDDALEGSEAHLAWMDEEVPADWIEGLRMRTASVSGRIILTFTPVSGYTPAVADYLDGARVVRWCQGYMLPRDGGEAAPWRALGLERWEHEALVRREDERSKLPQTVPGSRAEDCVRWVTGTWADRDENMEPGRVWELVPRVALCQNDGRAVVWFHGRDNPYGNPLEVIRKAAANRNGRDEIKTRCYGIALKAKGKRFKAFDRKVHVEEVRGKGEEVISGGRVQTPLARLVQNGSNAACAAGSNGSGEGEGTLNAERRTPNAEGKGEGTLNAERRTPNAEGTAGVRCYREWPGADDIPGVGVPEPWAKRSSRKKGLNDGDPDGGQTAFKFSVLRYKFEIARLEGWADYEAWEAAGAPGYEADGGWRIPYDDDLEAWSDANGSREEVAYRIVDGRACQQSKIGMQADKTLIDLLNEAGMAWEPASGAGIGSGEDRINQALDWVRGMDGKLAKRPSLVFSERCRNHIFAMENYMGEDGQKGACKEPVDCLRYLYQSGLTEEPPAGGMNVLVLDPAPERNWFMAWYRVGGGEVREEVRGKREEVIRGDGEGERGAMGNGQSARGNGERDGGRGRPEAGGRGERLTLNAERRTSNGGRREREEDAGEERPCAGGGWVCGR